MIEIKGKYNTAKVFVDDYDKLEEACYKQILNLLNQKFCENSQIRIMEDCHAGSGCVIGFTQTIVDKVVPNLVGVDIGCGFKVVKYNEPKCYYNFNKKRIFVENCNNDDIKKLYNDGKLKYFDESKSIKENMKENKIYRIYDCGNVEMIYK